MNFEQPSDKAETKEMGRFTLEKLFYEVQAMKDELVFLQKNPNPSELSQAFTRLAEERIEAYTKEVERRSKLN